MESVIRMCTSYVCLFVIETKNALVLTKTKIKQFFPRDKTCRNKSSDTE
jgi:hypothetical protein